MIKGTKFTPMELLLLIAMSMLGLLATLLLFVGEVDITGGGTIAHFPFAKLDVFVPAFAVTFFNYFMVSGSFILSFLGIAALTYDNQKLKKLWTYSQVPFWLAQFLAFIVIGVYPIAAICIGLYLGVSVYLALKTSLEG